MPQNTGTLSLTRRYQMLIAAFLGWLLAGVQLGVSSVVMRDAAKDLLAAGNESDFGQWFGWLTSAFMFGAAAGGYLFGWVGDRAGRKTAMAWAIACYSIFAGISYFATTASQLLVLRFVVGLGVGGMWPNGISLVSEAWPNMSRPMLAGVIGTAANIGITLFSLLTCYVHVTPDHWRWVMVLSLAPLLLALWVAAFVPESPRWLAVRDRLQRSGQETAPSSKSPLLAVFTPPLLGVTLVGIALGTIPLFGGWGNSNWANAWASQYAGDPGLKARTLLARSAPGALASLLGGALATGMGRRRSYFLLSLACLFCSEFLFGYSHPQHPHFLWWTGALGFFSGFFFGWLPLCLPELFPTRVRSTGAGVSFNFGRIATALGILVAADLLKRWFLGDYAKIGQLTGWIYALGAIVIWFTPDTSDRGLED
jgi:MFS family permease